MRHATVPTWFFIASCSVLAGCSSQAGLGSASVLADVPAPGAGTVLARPALKHGGGSNPIQHIVLIIQENRSLNDLFVNFPGATTTMQGQTHTGKTVALKEVPLEKSADILHSLGAFIAACNGTGSLPGTNCRMNGFDLEQPNSGKAPYMYAPQAEVQPYWSMAQQYVLDGMMFPSHVDGSFVAHQYLIAAQADASVNFPNYTWGCNGKTDDVVAILGQERTITGSQPPCFDYQTLGDELDAASPQLSWRFYSPGVGKGGGCTGGSSHPDGGSGGGGYWSAYRAVSHICNGPDWTKDVVSPQTQFLTDVQNGILENVTWIVPSFSDSDHPGSHSNTGPSWVASLVNAVGQSQFWDSSLIVVVWDDWGGIYDPEPPPYKDYDGDGIRVPALCISPYAYQGKVDNTSYEFGSIDRLIEDNFGLGQLAAADARATSIGAGCINPSQSLPRPFVSIPAAYDRAHFLAEPRSAEPPDTDF